MPKVVSKSRVKRPTPYESQTFNGLHNDADGTRQAVRRAPLPGDASRKERRSSKRATERKVLQDMFRLTSNMLELAMQNKIVLNFRVSDFVRARVKGGVKLEGGGPFGALAEFPIMLKVCDGPRLLVDLDGVIVFLYCPKFMGEGLQRNILEKLSALVRVCPPSMDASCGDRRSRVEETPVAAGTRRTRSRGLAEDTYGPITEKCVDPLSPVRWLDVNYELGEDDESDEEWEDLGSQDTCSESSGEIEEQEEVLEITKELLECREEMNVACLYRNVLPPSSYYISPGLYGTGQEKKNPIAVSGQFQQALQEPSRKELVDLLEAKRLYHRNIASMIEILHPALSNNLKQLKDAMAEIPRPTSVVLANGWNSLFPCVGFGLNRQTSIHRDAKGFRGGLDVISVLGNFRNGHFRLQDLNVVMEWQPGCLGAFDGYDLTHEVLEWEGTHRITLISFCRSSTWRGLKVPYNVPHPTLAQLEQNMQKAAPQVRQGSSAGQTCG